MSQLPKPTTLVEVIDELREQSGAVPGTEWREEMIRASVLAALGRPRRLLKVSVLPLWGDNFRVNVWTGDDAAADGIPNSYFVTADARGSIIRSEPPIQKQY